jgi:large subunit ribosomal protein L31
MESIYQNIKETPMKQGIHPDVKVCKVSCACGNAFETKSTVEALRVEICNECHPFFTGSEKIVDAAGRVEKFNKRFNRS